MIKFKRDQKGFAAVETVLIVMIVALIAFVAWFAFHTKSNTDTTLDNTPNAQSVAKEKTSKTPANTTPSGADVVTTKTSSTVGQYLADTSGKTLYTYGADTTGKSNCTGSCLTDWPIYKATSSSNNLPDNITIITRSDGGTQYAYKGMPLYYFSGDTSAGMVTGDGVNNFHVAKP